MDKSFFIKPRVKKTIIDGMRWMVLLLSLLLIIYISYDTFNDIPFLQNRNYMNFQLWVCIVFMGDFFIEMLYSPNKWKYFRYNIFFFLISIPYLNIIDTYDIDFSREQLYFIRFIPLVRGAYALAVVVGYVSHNKISSMFASYLAILLSCVYFASLIFYEREFPVNPQVTSYGDAIWWACMNVTTLGAPIIPMTDIGRWLCVCLGGLGMMMFPLFTVYFTNMVTQRNRSRQIQIFGSNSHKNNGQNMPQHNHQSTTSIHSKSQPQNTNIPIPTGEAPHDPHSSPIPDFSSDPDREAGVN